ncbi:MAG: hypothetical protein F6J92_03355 [Symploca sp. SIO1A3]|nr:hypothetical protein [Symploca sp. SIO1A3]
MTPSYQLIKPQSSAEANITVPANTSNPAVIPTKGELTPLLIYGGVAVAMVIALTRYSKTLIESVAKLVKIVKKEN